MKFAMDFCSTSILRPNILEQCYLSFQKNLVDIDLKECRLFLNIDCVPNTQSLWAWGNGAAWPYTPKDNIAVAERFFGSVVTRIESKRPSLHKAINWMWSQVESRYVFFLEDDWKLLRPVSVMDILDKFKSKKLQQVRLRWEPDEFYRRGRTLTYGLAPSVCRKFFCKHYVNKIKRVKYCNPERFLKKHNPSPGRKVLLYPDSGQTVIDIGCDWKQDNKLWVRVSVDNGQWIRKDTYTKRCKEWWLKRSKLKNKYTPDVIMKEKT